MPTWGELLTELQQTPAPNGTGPDFDAVRRRYLQKLHRLTKRDTILYSTDYFGTGGMATAIVLEDMQGMMEVNKGLRGPELDIILHSPGGDPDATASIVKYLRKKFSHIRVFVPLAAMSAATMWALAADEIVMGKHSQLGPIDPQIISGQQAIPARAIVDQFEKAKDECKKDPAALGAWLPILQQYGPGLLEQCASAEALSRQLVTDWLAAYMFKDRDDPDADAVEVANWFADAETHKSHGLGIDREQAKAQGLNVTDLEVDQELQDLVLTVHHATIHTLGGPAVKIIENHRGKAFVKLGGFINIQVPVQPGQAQQPLVPGQPLPASSPIVPG